MEQPQPVGITRAELNDIVAEAAEKGATWALAKLGLGDDRAGNDLRDLRGLLGAYQKVKDSMIRSLGMAIMGAIIGGLLILAKFNMIGSAR